MLLLIIRLFFNRHSNGTDNTSNQDHFYTVTGLMCRAEKVEFVFLKLSFHFSHNSFLPRVHPSPKPWLFRAQIVWKSALSALLVRMIAGHPSLWNIMLTALLRLTIWNRYKHIYLQAHRTLTQRDHFTLRRHQTLEDVHFICLTHKTFN